jgi:phage-related protein
MKQPPADLKPVVWIGSSHDDLKEFPERVQKIIGYALHLAQSGEKHPDVKPLTGNKVFKATRVVEVVENFDGDTYRAAYTVKLAGRVYMLHAFQKKSKKGIATPKAEIDLIVRRFAVAKHLHAEWLEERDSDEKEERD